MAYSALEQMFEENLISLNEVKTWDMEALKEFMRKRGRKVSGTKAELCAQVFVLYNDQVPEVPGAKEQEASRKAEYKKIFSAGPKTVDPMRLKKWQGEKDGMSYWPPVSYVEIVKFISKHGHSLSSSALKSYKTGKGFAYYYNDWLKEVFYHPIKKDSEVCYLKANCTPSNRLSDEPHSVWIKAKKDSGDIYSAYCSCTAG